MTADMGQQIWSFVGKVVTAGGGGAVVAYAIFRFLGKGWIENKFAKELEAAKSEISILASRKLKLHDREYIVFPEVWSRLNKAYDSLFTAVVSFNEIPNFEVMGESELKEWASSYLSDDERSNFTKVEDEKKGDAFARILEERKIRDSEKSYDELHSYLQHNRIFLSPEIKDKFDRIDLRIRQCLESWKLARNDSGYGDSTDYVSKVLSLLNDEITPLMLQIEHLVQAQVFPETFKGNTAGASK